MKVLLAVITILISVSSFSQDSVQMILDNYFENIGGREGFRNLSGQRMTARIDVQGMTTPIQVYLMADGRKLTKMNVVGKEVIKDAFDGVDAWGTDYNTQLAKKLKEEETENLKRAIGDYPSPLLDYEVNNYTIELLENEMVHDVSCFKLKLTKTPKFVDGEEVEDVEYFYIDQENYSLVKTESMVLSGPNVGETMTTLFSNYQQVGGLYFAYKMTYMSKDAGGQIIEIESIELNPEVKEGFFNFPSK